MVFNVVDWDENYIFLVEMFCEVVVFGFVGIYVKDDVGGLGFFCLDVVLIMEVLLWGCIFIMVFIFIYNMVFWMIDWFGFED